MKKNNLPFFIFMLLPMASLAANVAEPVVVAEPAPQISAVMDCQTHFPKDTKVIDLTIMERWATTAALQSFRFDPATIEPQLLALKPCYTDQGWQGFNDALKKSGNLDAIKSKQLIVSSQLRGKANLQAVKDNQWKITIPLQVIYHNTQQKITQSLTVDLLISRKASGDLGIMQVIAIPIKTAEAPATTGAGIKKP